MAEGLQLAAMTPERLLLVQIAGEMRSMGYERSSVVLLRTRHLIAAIESTPTFKDMCLAYNLHNDQDTGSSQTPNLEGSTES